MINRLDCFFDFRRDGTSVRKKHSRETAERVPTVRALSASSCTNPGRSSASPPDIERISGRSAILNVSTKRTNILAGACSLESVEFVEQCAQLSGQRRVRPKDIPAAGTERRASNSIKCISLSLLFFERFTLVKTNHSSKQSEPTFSNESPYQMKPPMLPSLISA